jgi:hypothetical protein
MDLTRDSEGRLIPADPLYLWWTGRDLPGTRRYGPQYPPPDLWRCHEHPEWQGEDIPVAWRECADPSDLIDRRKVWEEESIQAHAALHGFSVREESP